MRRRLNLLREFSVPPVAGVLAVLRWANHDPGQYQDFLYDRWLAGPPLRFVTDDLTAPTCTRPWRWSS